jgi:mannose-1-phosphate guanylyltransferase
MKADSHMYAVIMAGGRGERFWPLSTHRRPKQFIDLFGGQTLIAQAAERLRGFISPDHIFVITNRSLIKASSAVMPWLPPANIIGEPFGRDTAAAVALGAALVKRRDPDAALCILAADHIIGPHKIFQAALRRGMQHAMRTGELITIGIKPRSPNTGFGYIETSGPARGGFMPVRRFVEKPDASTARRYLKAGNYYWNSGMFIWSVNAIEAALAQYRPQLVPVVQRLSVLNPGTRAFNTALTAEYGKLERISIDYAVMEKARNIAMMKGDFDWDDVGSWNALANHFKPDANGNIVIGPSVSEDMHDSMILSEGPVTALLGVRDLVVVSTGSATLVCHRDRAQDIKTLIKAIRELPDGKKLL